MAELDISLGSRNQSACSATFWLQPLLGLAVGLAGGVLQSVILHRSLLRGAAYGALFGITFGLFFSRRTTSSGAGLIWGVAAALLVWIVGPAGIQPLRHSSHLMGMLNDARTTFPQLVASL